MKKAASSLLISVLIMPQIVLWANLSNMTCSYAGKYNQCVWANQSWWARSIEDFVCIEQKWGGEDMLLQIILDEKFSEIDEQAEEYLEKLEKDKEAYFWAEPQKSFLTALDDINTNFAQYEYYWKQYNDICNGIIQEELFTCIDSVNNINISTFLSKSETWVCESLFETKLKIYMQVAYDTLKLNRLAARQDDRKTYIIEERDKYSWILQTMLQILGYMERIVNGWVTKTKNPHT